MRNFDDSNPENMRELKRQQSRAAIVLAVLVLLVILLRAHYGNMLPAGWWHP